MIAQFIITILKCFIFVKIKFHDTKIVNHRLITQYRFFGKPENDISLVGDWKLINIIDTKTGEISPKGYDVMSINKNGELYYKGYKWAKFSSATQRKMNTSWFTINNEFYFHIDSETANINYDNSGYQYVLKGDTLEFKSSYKGKEIISTHIRLK